MDEEDRTDEYKEYEEGCREMYIDAQLEQQVNEIEENYGKYSND